MSLRARQKSARFPSRGRGSTGEEDSSICVRRARTHNLKGIDVTLPRDHMVVITGVSGSGKSSLAFDTLYAEGQRRYIESLSSYARQFLEQMPRPDCDQILGLPPTIAIEQQDTPTGQRSTVATITELYDYFRLLYARVGTPHCPQCGTLVEHQTHEQIVAAITDLPARARVTLLAPLVRGRRGHYRELFESIRADGYVKVRVDGEIHDVDDVERVQRYKTHDIDVVIDRLVIHRAASERLTDSVGAALEEGDGLCIALMDGSKEILFSQRFTCTNCGVGLEEPTPKTFSFNSPYGSCPECGGLGVVESFDEQLVVPNPDLTVDEGAVDACHGWGSRTETQFRLMLARLTNALRIDRNKPFRKLKKSQREALLWGRGHSEKGSLNTEDAVIPALQDFYERTKSETSRAKLRRYMSPSPCPACEGARLRPEALAVTVDGLNIYKLTALTISDCLGFFESVRFEGPRARIAAPICKGIKARLKFMMDVGLHYLSCDRAAGTLSRGEAQRIRLATQIGSGLTGVCYILDEPSIGLHYRDNKRLIKSLLRLRDGGNTVIVVEHDEATIRSGDWVLDLGPGAGRQGGEVIFNGPFDRMGKVSDSLTAQYMTRKAEIPIPPRRRAPKKPHVLTVKGAREHNLKNIDVEFPLGLFCCVTGVSGSGKSTLVNEILYRALARRIYGSRAKPGAYRHIRGADRIDSVLQIDQSPIGKTPRSTPATYIKVFDHIRRVFAGTREARVRGYEAGRFSFNVPGGRCEVCKGMGQKKVEMSFLPDVAVPCEECRGGRYAEGTLQITVRGKNISDVLAMTVEEALGFFQNHPLIARKLRTMRDVGLLYLTLGQPSPTLSGGEAQRIKLARELGKVSSGRTLYIFDEPTTGLHFDDVRKLLATLHGLADAGNTLIVIEHNLEVIKNADYIIDLGPEGGEGGGRIVATGTPEQVVKLRQSYTARALRELYGDRLAAKKE